MEYRTYLELKTKVLKDLDLEGEDFVQPEEMRGYFNAAIDEAESEIHTMYEDYFLDDAEIPLVSGEEFFDLPSNLYALKIRSIIFVNGSTFYPVTRLRQSNQFMLLQASKQSGSSDNHRYMIRNKAAFAKPRLQLVPIARDNTAKLIVEYIRNANRMVDDASICDIPEFSEFVIQSVKCNCYEKEGHPNLANALNERERLRKQMVDTLSNMIPDGDTSMEMDTSHYDEST